MSIPSLYIDCLEDEVVALATLETGFPDCRRLISNVAESSHVETGDGAGTERLGRSTNVGKLYAPVPDGVALQRTRGTRELWVGPIRGLLMPSVASDTEDVYPDEDDNQISLDDIQDDDDE